MQRTRTSSMAHTPPTTPPHQPIPRHTLSAPPHWSPRINLRGHLGGTVADDEALTPLHQRAARRLFLTPPRLQAPPPISPPPAARHPAQGGRAQGEGGAPAMPPRSPTRKVVASPQALDRLLARDPVAIVQATNLPMAQRLKLIDSALARSGALANGHAVMAMVERVLAIAEPQVRASALMVVLEHGRQHLAPGALRLARIGQDTLETMARCELLGAVGECVDAFQRSVDEVEAALTQALAADGEAGAAPLSGPPEPLIETKAGPVTPPPQGERIWFDGPREALRRRWDRVLQRRQERALAHAAQRMVAFYALFDCGGFLAARTAQRAGPPAMVSDTQWCFTLEQVAWLHAQARQGSPKAMGVAIEPAWLAREACQGGPHVGMVAMEAARRLQALVPEEPHG